MQIGMIYNKHEQTMRRLHHKTFNNWKEYIDDKFADGSLFVVEQYDKGNKVISSYRITSRDRTCETEVIVRIIIDDDFTKLHDVHFNHPNSPYWSAANKNNPYGMDRHVSIHTWKDLNHVDEWIDVPLFHGWTETTYYFDSIEIKTEAEWYPHEKGPIVLKQDYLSGYGCLTFPFLSFVIWNRQSYWKKHPERMKTVVHVIPAMIARDVNTK